MEMFKYDKWLLFCSLIQTFFKIKIKFSDLSDLSLIQILNWIPINLFNINTLIQNIFNN